MGMWFSRGVEHPQVCLHLAYILPVSDFPTPGFSPVPVLQNLTTSSSWGSRISAAAVQQPCDNWDFCLLSLERVCIAKTEPEVSSASIKTLHHHAAHTLHLREEVIERNNTWDCRLHETVSNLIKEGSDAYKRTYRVPLRCTQGLCCTQGYRRKKITRWRNGTDE